MLGLCHVSFAHVTTAAKQLIQQWGWPNPQLLHHRHLQLNASILWLAFCSSVLVLSLQEDAFQERVVQIRRVTKVVKGGKQLSFRAVVSTQPAEASTQQNQRGRMHAGR
jgi:hypothetical protein